MRTNLVGRSVVSAMTQTPASGPCGPVTTPPMSLGSTRTACAASDGTARVVTRPSTAATPQRRIVFIFPSVLHPEPLSTPGSSPPVPLSAYAERGDDERPSMRKDLGDLLFVPPLPQGEGDRG